MPALVMTHQQLLLVLQLWLGQVMLPACSGRSCSQQTQQQWQQIPQQHWPWLPAWLLAAATPAPQQQPLQLQLQQQRLQQLRCHLPLSSAVCTLHRAAQQVGAMLPVLHSCSSC
jgi:hypothetical protein